MRTFALVSAFLACACNGRRPIATKDPACEPSKALAALLSGSAPDCAFKPSMTPRSSRSSASKVFDPLNLRRSSASPEMIFDIEPFQYKDKDGQFIPPQFISKNPIISLVVPLVVITVLTGLSVTWAYKQWEADGFINEDYMNIAMKRQEAGR